MSRSTADIRNAFLNYFKQHGHQIVSSSSLVPHDDPTLLFTNAGMNQFKDVFLGAEKRDYTTAVSSQKCVRAGGKHNDLENVGYTARHHTFFEMLGNFSFGDYFKKQAITHAWTFLTTELGLPKEKLLVTIYHDDDEAFDIWANDIGVPADKIIRIATSDNFWSMGDTGPCGPCSEIFYDHGEHIWGGPPGTPEEDGDRFIEIWNLVFMQYNRQKDGTMQALPKPSIDTGMGLERISAILQNVHSNYEIDLFVNLIKASAEIVGTKDLSQKSLRVLADHIRSCAFLICDGVMPSNEGRGYVLRRIIRRAVRHGYKLGAQDIFFYKLVSALVAEMGQAYPDLVSQQAMIEKVLQTEEEQFSNTLARGMSMLNAEISNMSGDILAGDLVFKLYDTYGFPADLTADIAREHSLKIDEAGFENAMQAQKARAQSASKFGADYNTSIKTDSETQFTGYTEQAGKATIKELFVDGQAVDSADNGQAIVILDSTPFYAESGGQAGDQGWIISGSTKHKVVDTQKLGDAFAHHVQVQAKLTVNDSVELAIDSERRTAIKANHSATHLIHAALRKLLGEHVTQKGSLVEADKFRFDFSHFESISNQQLLEVENLVNAQIRQNHTLHTQVMGLEEAKAAGAMALFGEKYDDKVRVVSMGEFSTELCGGTHVERTGDIGLFKIVSETGIASGVRRIEAITGQRALDFVHDEAAKLISLANLFKTDKANVIEKATQLQQQLKVAEKSLEQVQASIAGNKSKALLDQAIEIAGIKCVISELNDIEPKALRAMLDDLKNQLGSGLAILGLASGDKVNLIAGVTQDLTKRVKAGDIVNHVASQVGGKGGGRPDMAQAGGNQPENLKAALNSVEQWLLEKLQ